MASSVLHVKALRTQLQAFNCCWSTTSTVGTVDPLCITRLAPLETTWCTASGSPIEPEVLLPCTSHWVLLCTRLLIVIMNSVLYSSLDETANTCSLCLSIRPSTMDLETMIHAEIESEDDTQNH